MRARLGARIRRSLRARAVPGSTRRLVRRAALLGAIAFLGACRSSGAHSAPCDSVGRSATYGLTGRWSWTTPVQNLMAICLVQYSPAQVEGMAWVGRQRVRTFGTISPTGAISLTTLADRDEPLLILLHRNGDTLFVDWIGRTNMRRNAQGAYAPGVLLRAGTRPDSSR